MKFQISTLHGSANSQQAVNSRPSTTYAHSVYPLYVPLPHCNIGYHNIIVFLSLSLSVSLPLSLAT